MMKQTFCFSYGVAQRLYLEVRHAVRELYVRAAGENGQSGAHAWYCASAGGLTRTPADAADLPGPCGGHSLHVQPKQAEEDGPAQLPKAR
jgi:hypothetical protein